MGGLVSKTAVATADDVTETAPFDPIANTNDGSKINTNDGDAINDPGKTNTNKNEEGNSPRAVIDGFDVVKENENKASEAHHSGTDVKETTQVGEKSENANQALEDHHPGMINKEHIQTGTIKYNGKEIKSSIKRTSRRKAQKVVVVVEDTKEADEDVAEKKKPSVELKTDKEEETPNAEGIVAEDMKEDQKKKRKITRKTDTSKSKRKRRTL